MSKKDDTNKDQTVNPVDRFVKYLKDKGIGEEEVAFMTGRLAKRATNKILKDTLELFDESEKEKIEKMDEEEFLAEIKKRIAEKRGLNYEDYQMAVYKELVDEIIGEGGGEE
jgi:hypothetical protein